MDDNLKAQDEARFGPDASDDEVRAALACRYCMRTAEVVVVVDGLHGINAFCRCGSCDPQTVVALNRDQLARLRNDPPSGIDFDFLP